MHFLEWIDWGFIEAFFGENGKLVASTFGVVAGLATLAVALFNYLHAKILEKERNAARRDLQKSRADLQDEKDLVRNQQLALKEKASDLDRKNDELRNAVDAIRFREQKL